MCDVLAIHLSIAITRTTLKFRPKTRKSCENAEKMRNPPPQGHTVDQSCVQILSRLHLAVGRKMPSLRPSNLFLRNNNVPSQLALYQRLYGKNNVLLDIKTPYSSDMARNEFLTLKTLN